MSRTQSLPLAAGAGPALSSATNGHGVTHDRTRPRTQVVTETASIRARRRGYSRGARRNPARYRPVREGAAYHSTDPASLLLM